MQFEITNGVLVKYNQEYGVADVVVPETVTCIGERAFADSETIKSVKLPNGVTKIENGAFSFCHNLTKVTLPDSVMEIGYSIFFSCTKLKQIVIPPQISRINPQTFYGCINLQSVCLPSALTAISKESFCDCEKLKSIIIPSSVKTVEKGAFGGCKKLTEFTVLGNIGSVDTSIFKRYFGDKGYLELNKKLNIKAFEMPLSTIDGDLKQFAVTGFLEAIEVGQKLSDSCIKNYYNYIKSQRKKLYPMLFNNPTLLRIMLDQKMITLYEVNSLIQESDKKQLPEVTDKLLEYRNNISSDDLLAKKALLEEINDYWRYAEKDDGSIIITDYRGKALDVSIPDNIDGKAVTEIGKFAFSPAPGVKGILNNVRTARKKLKSVFIPEAIQHIGSGAFACCESLETINIPKNIAIISPYIFADCSKLQTVDLPNNITQICTYAFSGCRKLKSICIPEAVKEIDEYAFMGCWNLKQVDIYGKDTVLEEGGGVFSASEKVIIRTYENSPAWEYAEKHCIKHEKLKNSR